MLRRFKKNFEGKKSYQDKRDSEQNWQMIESQIGDSRNALDVACDAGFYSLKLAQMGLFVVGFDILASSLKKATQDAQKKGLSNDVYFLEMALTPENVLKLPQFDSILCLSVYHHFFRLYGEENAKEMIRNLFRISKKQLFLQIPSKIGKYGNGFSIDFNGDKDLTEKYIRDIFLEVSESKVVYIGKKKERPPTENYRYMFCIKKI